MNKQKILIVDDDENIAELVSLYLTKECFDTMMVHDGERALVAFDTYKPNLILLDLMLPGIDGYQVCREIRTRSNTPIIMLSAKGEVFDKVLGLELGADDYIMKPFDAKELVARVKAVLRRYQVGSKPETPQADKGKCVEYPGIEINLTNYSVIVDGHTVEMPPKELELLYFLASSPHHRIRYSQESSYWIRSGAMNISAIPVPSMCTSNVSARRSRITMAGVSALYGESVINLK